jgi:hypothetical protein
MPRKRVLWAVVAVLIAGGAFGLYWFTPWKLVTNTTVHETLSTPAPTVSADPAGTLAGPAVVGQGTFVSHEHPTSGTARVVRAADGSQQLELVGLSTSDGPDLRVWLTDQPATAGGKYVELGRLKGNRGDQVYPIPAGTDVATYRTVTIWCIRFSVSFGAAMLG